MRRGYVERWLLSNISTRRLVPSILVLQVSRSNNILPVMLRIYRFRISSACFHADQTISLPQRGSGRFESSWTLLPCGIVVAPCFVRSLGSGLPYAFALRVSLNSPTALYKLLYKGAFVCLTFFIKVYVSCI